MQVPSESFSVLIEESSGTSHLFLTGWLDAAAVPPLLHAITRAKPRDVVIDIDGLERVDGAGWLGVISCEQRVANWGGRLRIANGIRKILQLDPAQRRSPGG